MTPSLAARFLPGPPDLNRRAAIGFRCAADIPT